MVAERLDRLRIGATRVPESLHRQFDDPRPPLGIPGRRQGRFVIEVDHRGLSRTAAAVGPTDVSTR